MSDGRVSDFERKEDYQKFRMISAKQFIAITGDRTKSDEIYDLVKYSEEPYSLFQISRLVRSDLKRNPSSTLVNIIICGVNGSSIFYNQFDSSDLKKIDSGIKERNVIKFMNSLNIDRHFWGERFIKEISEVNYNNPLEVIKVQESINDQISCEDSTVNKIKFYKVIEF